MAIGCRKLRHGWKPKSLLDGMKRDIFEKIILVGLLVLAVGVAFFFAAALGWVVRPLVYWLTMGGGGLLVILGIAGVFLADEFF